MPDSPPDYVFFLDHDEEAGCTNIYAAVTNYGLYGESTENWTGEAGEPFRNPNAKLIRGGSEFEGLGATFFRDNSGVSWCGANREHLGPELPEAVARKLHPRLFERIEKAESEPA
jgi:hypothetical protein